MAPVDDGLWIAQTAERIGILHAEQEIVGLRQGCRDDRACAGERPEPQPQVGIVDESRPGALCRIDGGEYRIAGAVTDGLADARRMEVAGARNQFQRQAFRRQAAGRRTLAHVTEHVPRGTMRDEIHCGMGLRIDRNAGGVKPFVTPQLQKLAAELVVPEPGDIGDARTLTGRRDRAVHGIAAEALQKPAGRLRYLAELVERFAERNDVDIGCGHAGALAAIARNPRAWAMTAPPMPTTAAPALK